MPNQIEHVGTTRIFASNRAALEALIIPINSDDQVLMIYQEGTKPSGGSVFVWDKEVAWIVTNVFDFDPGNPGKPITSTDGNGRLGPPSLPHKVSQISGLKFVEENLAALLCISVSGAIELWLLRYHPEVEGVSPASLEQLGPYPFASGALIRAPALTVMENGNILITYQISDDMVRFAKFAHTNGNNGSFESTTFSLAQQGDQHDLIDLESLGHEGYAVYLYDRQGGTASGTKMRLIDGYANTIGSEIELPDHRGMAALLTMSGSLRGGALQRTDVRQLAYIGLHIPATGGSGNLSSRMTYPIWLELDNLALQAGDKEDYVNYSEHSTGVHAAAIPETSPAVGLATQPDRVTTTGYAILPNGLSLEIGPEGVISQPDMSEAVRTRVIAGALLPSMLGLVWVIDLDELNNPLSTGYYFVFKVLPLVVPPLRINQRDDGMDYGLRTIIPPRITQRSSSQGSIRIPGGVGDTYW